MKTPKEYKEMINEGYITREILGNVIYSTIKREYNWKSKKKSYEKYNKDYYITAKEKEEEYKKMKEDFFLNIKPSYIAKKVDFSEVVQRYHSNPKYDKDSKYSFIKIAKNINNFKIKNINCFFDDNIQQYVDFVDVVVGKKVNCISYALNYNLGNHNFYKQINSKDILDYRDLDIVECKEFETLEQDMLSSQFCKKVYYSLMNNNLIIKQ